MSNSITQLSKENERKKYLFISPLNVAFNNGMMQRQIQFLEFIDNNAIDLDIFSLYSSPSDVKRWLNDLKINASVLGGIFGSLARINAIAWYGGNVILCNKFKIINQFHFPVRTPIPKRILDRYDRIVCYYPWGFSLLRLERAGSKVVVDLGDVMADRHDRIGTRRWISLSRKVESSILNSNARCIAITLDDQREFQRLYGLTLPVIPFLPPGHEQLRALPPGTHARKVGFLAALGYQNEEVVKALASEEFLSCMKASGIELVIAGGICAAIPEHTRAAIQGSGGQVLGRVGSLEDFYSQIGVVLNPVGPSTGVKIKSVEALMAGRGLITTKYGADAELQDLFSNQITLLNWPLNVPELARATAQSVLKAVPAVSSAHWSTDIQRAADNYEQRVISAMNEYLLC